MNSLRAKGRTVAEFLERSIANSSDPAALADFRAFHSGTPNPIKRRILLGMCSLAVTHPTATGKLIGRSLPDDVRYVGAGYHSIVYRQGEDVIKVNRHSIGMTEAERKDLAITEQSRHDIMRSFLGKMIIPESVSVAPHPYAPKLRAVQIRQPYTSYTDLGNVFPLDTASIDRGRLREILRSQPELDEAFYSLATGGITIANEYGLAPDIMRRGNIGITDTTEPKVVIVDGQPVKAGDHGYKEYILSQLEDLQNFLDSPAASVH